MYCREILYFILKFRFRFCFLADARNIQLTLLSILYSPEIEISIFQSRIIDPYESSEV